MFRWWITGLVCLLIFLVPSNLFISFPTGAEYVTGLRVDYLIPKLFLSDLVALAIILMFLVKKRQRLIPFVGAFLKNQKLKWAVISALLLLLLLVRQSVSVVPMMSQLTLLHLLLGTTLMLVLLQLNLILRNIYVLSSLIVTILFQTVIAVFQWLTQTSVAGFFFLGEPNLRYPLGLAKTLWFGQEKILPYGTTAHPNVLGGIMAVYAVILLYNLLFHSQPKKVKLVTYLALIGGVVTLALTQSVSAIIAFIIGVLVMYIQLRQFPHNYSLLLIEAWKYWLIVIGSCIISIILLNVIAPQYQVVPSIERRARLNTAALELVLQQPIVGVGLTNFTTSLDQSVSQAKVIVPFLQPVHNTLLLSLSEVGLLGIAVICIVAYLLRHSPLTTWQLGWFASRIPLLYLIFVPIALLDHYLLTLQSGQLLMLLSPLLFMKAQAKY